MGGREAKGETLTASEEQSSGGRVGRSEAVKQRALPSHTLTALTERERELGSGKWLKRNVKTHTHTH